MYEQYYGFREKPFSMAPDPDFLYFGRHHRRALTQLEFGLANEAAFLLITGEVGSGKTTLIRYLLDRLDRRYVAGFVGSTTRESGSLLQWIGDAFALACSDRDDGALRQAFSAHLMQEHAAGRRALLIVDEAQNLGAARLEDLRVLSNLNHGKRLLLQTVLVGQPELAKHLRAPRLRQFAQRIGADYHIGRLSEAESHGYVLHRLQVAGGAQPDLFTAEAIELAHQSSRGIPRLLNQLCDTALVYGYAEERDQIDGSLMRDVIADRCAGGVYPGKPVGASPTDATPRMAALSAKPGAV